MQGLTSILGFLRHYLCVYSSMCFFAWAATIGKIPTDDMLKRRNFRGPSRCSMCLEEEEIVDHLLVHSHWVSALWDLALSLMGISWVQPSNVRDVVVAWRRRMKKSWILGVWNMVWLFGGLSGRREIAVSLTIKSYRFKILSSIFWGCCMAGVLGLVVTKI